LFAFLNEKAHQQSITTDSLFFDFNLLLDPDENCSTAFHLKNTALFGMNYNFSVIQMKVIANFLKMN
jgi:hypothetical protein